MKTGEVYVRFTLRRKERVTLRSLRKGDLGACTKFVNQLVRERQTNPLLGVTLDRLHTKKQEEEEYLTRVLDGIAKDEGVNVAAFVGEQMVGNCDIFRRKPSDVRHTGLLGIAILDGYRGLGLGQRMLGILLGRAKEIGVTLVELEVFANNERAIHLYRKRGFKVVGKIPRKIMRKGEYTDAIAMYAQL